MKVLTPFGGIWDNLKESVTFNFTRRKTFDGNDVPGKFVNGIYYTPDHSNFATIGSFGVDSERGTCTTSE